MGIDVVKQMLRYNTWKNISIYSYEIGRSLRYKSLNKIEDVWWLQNDTVAHSIIIWYLSVTSEDESLLDDMSSMEDGRRTSAGQSWGNSRLPPSLQQSKSPTKSPVKTPNRATPSPSKSSNTPSPETSPVKVRLCHAFYINSTESVCLSCLSALQNVWSQYISKVASISLTMWHLFYQISKMLITGIKSKFTIWLFFHH